MYSEIRDYKSAQQFAKTYKSKKKNKPGVSRAYIHYLINQEKKSPGSTGLDVVSIDGHYYVREAS